MEDVPDPIPFKRKLLDGVYAYPVLGGWCILRVQNGEVGDSKKVPHVTWSGLVDSFEGSLGDFGSSRGMIFMPQSEISINNDGSCSIESQRFGLYIKPQVP